jgi:hypothetical protein
MMLPEAVWNSVVSVAEDRLFLRATSALQHSAIPFCEFMWSTTLLLRCFCSWTFPARAGQRFYKWTCWKGGILRQCHIESLWKLHGCVLDFMHLSATGVAEIAESTNCIYSVSYAPVHRKDHPSGVILWMSHRPTLSPC